MDDVLVSIRADTSKLFGILKESNRSNKTAIADIKVEGPNEGGEGFTSRCEYATIILKTDPVKKLEVFVKRRLQNQPQLLEILDEMEMFETETAFFRDLLPNLVAFCRRKCGNTQLLQSMIPKCYYADTQLIVLENLTKRGFIMWDKSVPHNLEQAKAVLQNLAKLHGTSYAYIEQSGIEKVLSQYPLVKCANIWGEASKGIRTIFVQSAFDGAVKILKTFPTSGSEEALVHFQSYGCDAYGKVLKHFDLKTPSCATVLNHGDCWGNNIMWNSVVDPKGSPEYILVDWQGVHLGSPVLDLAFYLLFTVEPEGRHQHWKELVRVYHDWLTAYSKMFGTEVKFTYKDLLREFQDKCEHGYVFEIFGIVIMEGLQGMPSVDAIEDNCLDYYTSAFRAAADRIQGEMGYDTSAKLVRAYRRLRDMTTEKI